MQLKWLSKSLKNLPPDTTVPILQGRLRGKKWLAAASRNAYWLGTYEADKCSLVAKTLRPGQIFYDVGAHVGYYTLLASFAVGPTGRVFAFEPLPQNLDYLYRHLQLNDVKNVQVLEAAVSDVEGVSGFAFSFNRSMGRLSHEGQLQVDTVRLDDLVAGGAAPPPDCIKIDIEGAELHALQGAQLVLQAHHPKVFVATHSRTLHQQCRAFLREQNFQVTELEWVERDVRGELYAE